MHFDMIFIRLNSFSLLYVSLICDFTGLSRAFEQIFITNPSNRASESTKYIGCVTLLVCGNIFSLLLFRSRNSWIYIAVFILTHFEIKCQFFVVAVRRWQCSFPFQALRYPNDVITDTEASNYRPINRVLTCNSSLNPQ
jgi:hypothetical protein